jgi:DNA ligase-associated metallophosphoesterase
LTVLHWSEQRLELLPERAIWDPAQRLLLLADLHLGKAECFQAQGIPLPSDGDRANLQRLLMLCRRLRPLEVLVLGDLIHGRQGLGPELRRQIDQLPEQLGCQLTLVEGNHDRGSRLATLPATASQARGALWLSHGPEAPPPQLLNICGHLHPVAQLGAGADRLRLPCFALDRRRRQLLLPAFGDLTGGHPCPPGLQRWAIAEGQVLPLD